MISSSDGGDTARYRFSAPFTADQILGPNLDIVEMAGIFNWCRLATGD
jgi:hypothetical protein